jgi:hypothetical protein
LQENRVLLIYVKKTVVDNIGSRFQLVKEQFPLIVKYLAKFAIGVA